MAQKVELRLRFEDKVWLRGYVRTAVYYVAIVPTLFFSCSQHFTSDDFFGCEIMCSGFDETALLLRQPGDLSPGGG